MPKTGIGIWNSHGEMGYLRHDEHCLLFCIFGDFT